MGISLFCVAGMLLAASMVFALVITVGNVQKQDREVMFVLAIIFLAMTVLMSFAAWVMFKTLFRCHEFGICQRGAFQELTMLYKEVDEFTYSATKHYHKGAYLGTQLKMTFVPMKELNKPKMVFSTTIKNADNSLDELRDVVAATVGTRMLQEVQAGQAVAWTDSATLEAEQLRYTPGNWFSKQREQTIAYRDIASFTLHQGKCAIYERGKPKPIITLASSKRNFFPGYYAFSVLYESAQKTSSEDPEPSRLSPDYEMSMDVH
jgi:hypothetical protein